ncbi:metalloregulator ArsR/SmtB family transcription factor [Stenotrophomonas sp.]|uniref:ArsR/SmtB family transcription factor n=1 Tax=Stenotrophomonas sp. TaxID=69392 RepID=UPI0028ADD163|nr:metalloregulator ArsR/SmtB family transcription factor [Stenotrophomonas sp.]
MEHITATRALAALSHGTRLSIYRLLVEAGRGGKLAGEIAEALTLPGATLSLHLKELSAAGLVSSEQRGRTVCYRANFDAMTSLVDYLTENCCAGDQSCGTPGRC